MAAPEPDRRQLATGGPGLGAHQPARRTCCGRLLLVHVAVAVFACTLAIQTAGTRMIFSMARDGRCRSPRLGKVVAAHRHPGRCTSIVVGVGAALALVVNIGQSAIFTALTSLCIAMLYMAYLGSPCRCCAPDQADTGRASRAGVDEDGKPLFTLGRWGIPVNALAVLYQAVMVVNLVWPRGGDLRPHRQRLVAAVERHPVHRRLLLVGAAYHSYSRRRHRCIVLTEVPTSHVTSPAATAVTV